MLSNFRFFWILPLLFAWGQTALTYEVKCTIISGPKITADNVFLSRDLDLSGEEIKIIGNPSSAVEKKFQLDMPVLNKVNVSLDTQVDSSRPSYCQLNFKGEIPHKETSLRFEIKLLLDRSHLDSQPQPSGNNPPHHLRAELQASGVFTFLNADNTVTMSGSDNSVKFECEDTVFSHFIDDIRGRCSK